MARKKVEKLPAEIPVKPLAAFLFEVQGAMRELEAQEKMLKDALLENLKRQGVRRVDMDNGKSYIRVRKTSISVVSGREAEARKWAESRYALKIDTGVVKDILHNEGVLDAPPPGFKRTDTEYLRVAGTEDNNAENYGI